MHAEAELERVFSDGAGDVDGSSDDGGDVDTIPEDNARNSDGTLKDGAAACPSCQHAFFVDVPHKFCEECGVRLVQSKASFSEGKSNLANYKARLKSRNTYIVV